LLIGVRLMNNRNYIQSLGVDISNSPPRTCAVLLHKLSDGTMEIHDEWHWDRALTAEEVEQFRRNVAKVLMKTPLGIAMSVDVADFGNWEQGR
jgi:hypothetical protein